MGGPIEFGEVSGKMTDTRVRGKLLIGTQTGKGVVELLELVVILLF